jgi:hypothetical protein
VRALSVGREDPLTLAFPIVLFADGQELSGPFPVGIVHLPFLESIEFLAGNLSGPLPSDDDILGRLTHLVHVNLGHNQLSGEIPIEWWHRRVSLT